jgi:PilZ domain
MRLSFAPLTIHGKVIEGKRRRSFSPLKFLRFVPMTGSGDFADEVPPMAELELSVEEFDEQHERRMAAPEGVVERRKHTRYAVDAWAEVMVKDGRMLFRGRVLDISIGGCYVETEARLRLAPGTPVEMVFRLNDDVFRCDATSRMIRTKGAGFLFSNLNVEVQMGLERLIRELGED